MSHRETRPEYGTVVLTDLPHIGSSENFDILDHNSKKFLLYTIYSSTAIILSRSGMLF